MQRFLILFNRILYAIVLRSVHVAHRGLFPYLYDCFVVPERRLHGKNFSF